MLLWTLPPIATAIVSAMQRTRLWLASLSLIAVAACGGGGGGTSARDPDTTPSANDASTDGPVLDPDKVEPEIARQFAERNKAGGFTLTKVTCPDDVAGTVGYESNCEVVVSTGESGSVTIKVLDTKGNFKIVGVNA